MTVEIFWFHTAIAPPRAARALDLLASDERERARRLRAPGHRERFIAARAGLRALLAQKLTRAPAEIVFAYEPQGKPFLPNAEWRFNLSHSGDYAVVAISRDGEVGIDIERERPRLDTLGIARRFFTPAERAWLESHSTETRTHAFVRLWSCKEAWLKLTGKGLALPLDQVEVAFELEARLSADGVNWPAQELQIVDGYAAALVTAHPHLPAPITQIQPFA